MQYRELKLHKISLFAATVVVAAAALLVKHTRTRVKMKNKIQPISMSKSARYRIERLHRFPLCWCITVIKDLCVFFSCILRLSFSQSLR